MAEEKARKYPIFPLVDNLRAVLPAISTTLRWRGPRWWWAGSLDVEGLALGAAEAFVAALGLRGSHVNRNRFSLESRMLAASFNSFGNLRIGGASCTQFAPLSGFHEAADGWVRLHANYRHHHEALQVASGASETASIIGWVREHACDDIEDKVAAAGGLAVRVREPGEWATSSTAQSLVTTPWIDFDTRVVTEAPLGNTAAQSYPLQGVRILDLTRVIAGPSATRLLGALGADVLRVDPPLLPELWEQYVDTGFDKRSAVADLNDRETRETIHKLLDSADGIMLGYRSRALDRFGFDADSLLERHPGLAVVSVDAWGEKGAYGGRRGFDSLVQAGTGIAHLYGTGEGESWRPGTLPVQALDHATGLGMGAALLALLVSRQEGVSGAARLSLARTAMELLAGATPRDVVPDSFEIETKKLHSPYGMLEFVPPPLEIDGVPLNYGHAPGRYGTSSLDWAVPRAARERLV